MRAGRCSLPWTTCFLLVLCLGPPGPLADAAVLHILETEARDAARAQASAASAAARSLESAVGSAVAALRQTEVDAALGPAPFIAFVADKGPQSLEEYCKGKGGNELQQDQKVEANWKGYGEFYPGKIVKVHEDGNVDVLYEDGWTETKVTPDNVRKIEDGPKGIDPKDDPACQLKEFVSEVQEKIDSVHDKMDTWTEAVKAGELEDDEVEELEAEAPVVGGAVAETMGLIPASESSGSSSGSAAATSKSGAASGVTPGNIDDSKDPQLKKLKAELEAKDKELESLEGQVKQKDDTIIKELKGDKNQPVTAKTLAELIEEYRRRIEHRNLQIERLKARLREQEEQLARLRGQQAAAAAPKKKVKLEEIQKEVEELDDLVASAKAKRDKLRAEGKLDPELERSLDKIFTEQAQLSAQMEKLAQLRKEMKAKKEAAKEAASRAEREQAAKEAQESEARVLEAAQAVTKDIRSLKQGAQELDKGVVPSATKWWRYTWERSYVEALLMVLVTVLMFVWERFYRFMRYKVYEEANVLVNDYLTHGTMYIKWLESFAGELMICLMAFVTCWVLAQFQVFEMLPELLKENEKLHLPQTGDEYQRMVVDKCVVLVFAMFLYFMLMLSVVRSTTQALCHWAELEIQADGASPMTPGRAHMPRGFVQRHLSSFGTVSRVYRVEDLQRYKKMKEYFHQQVQHDTALLEVLRSQSNGVFDVKNFPLFVYLRRSVRAKVDGLFQFGPAIWISLITTFVALTLLHRFAHLGYMRIMTTVAVLLCLLLGLMGWWISSINRFIDAECEGGLQVSSIHQRISTENLVLFMLHCLGIFTCYGAARMICQPYMWELHFWSVLAVTGICVLLAVLFALFIAPLIPTFAFVMSIPPFVDPEDADEMLAAVKYREEQIEA